MSVASSRQNSDTKQHDSENKGDSTSSSPNALKDAVEDFFRNFPRTSEDGQDRQSKSLPLYLQKMRERQEWEEVMKALLFLARAGTPFFVSFGYQWPKGRDFFLSRYNVHVHSHNKDDNSAEVPGGNHRDSILTYLTQVRAEDDAIFQILDNYRTSRKFCMYASTIVRSDFYTLTRLIREHKKDSQNLELEGINIFNTQKIDGPNQKQALVWKALNQVEVEDELVMEIFNNHTAAYTPSLFSSRTGWGSSTKNERYTTRLVDIIEHARGESWFYSGNRTKNVLLQLKLVSQEELDNKNHTSFDIAKSIIQKRIYDMNHPVQATTPFVSPPLLF